MKHVGPTQASNHVSSGPQEETMTYDLEADDSSPATSR